MKLTVREMTRIALFSSLICIASLILKFGGNAVVPFSILPFMVLLSGAILGPRSGAISVAIYVLIGLVGAPVFSAPPFGGLAYILQPTFGFLPGFILAAYLVGKILGGRGIPSLPRYLIASVAGALALYVIGIPYLYGILHVYLGKPVTFWYAVQIGFLPFIGLDLLKALAAGIIARGVAGRLANQGTPRCE